MAYGIRVKFEELREVDFGDVSSSYVAVGTPFTQHTRLVSFNNSMDQDLYISLDGSTDQLRIAKNSFKLLDLSANKVRDDGLFLEVGTQISVKIVTGSVTEGSFWVETLYGETGK